MRAMGNVVRPPGMPGRTAPDRRGQGLGSEPIRSVASMPRTPLPAGEVKRIATQHLVAKRREIRYTGNAREALMLRRLIPQEYDFFDHFEKAAGHAVAASKLLLKLTESFGDADPIARELEEVEHACDEVAHVTMDQLNKTFVTPLDREDIHAIILRIDDVVDLTNASANRMAFFGIDKPSVHSVNMATQSVRGCEKAVG